MTLQEAYEKLRQVYPDGCEVREVVAGVGLTQREVIKVSATLAKCAEGMGMNEGYMRLMWFFVMGFAIGRVVERAEVEEAHTGELNA